MDDVHQHPRVCVCVRQRDPGLVSALKRDPPRCSVCGVSQTPPSLTEALQPLPAAVAMETPASLVIP